MDKKLLITNVILSAETVSYLDRQLLAIRQASGGYESQPTVTRHLFGDDGRPNGFLTLQDGAGSRRNARIHPVSTGRAQMNLSESRTPQNDYSVAFADSPLRARR